MTTADEKKSKPTMPTHLILAIYRAYLALQAAKKRTA